MPLCQTRPTSLRVTPRDPEPVHSTIIDRESGRRPCGHNIGDQRPDLPRETHASRVDFPLMKGHLAEKVPESRNEPTISLRINRWRKTYIGFTVVSQAICGLFCRKPSHPTRRFPRHSCHLSAVTCHCCLTNFPGHDIVEGPRVIPSVKGCFTPGKNLLWRLHGREGCIGVCEIKQR